MTETIREERKGERLRRIGLGVKGMVRVVVCFFFLVMVIRLRMVR